MASLEEALGLEAPPAEGKSLEAALGLEAEQPSVMERLGRGVEAGITGIGEFVQQAPAAGLSGLRTALGLLTGRPEMERLKGTAKGAGQAVSFGAYQPEFSSEEEAEAALGGRYAAGTGLGMGLSKVVTPLVGKLLGALTPSLGKAAVPVAKTTEAALYSAPGAAASAIQGGDPLEGFTAGMTAAGVGATLAGLAQRTAKFVSTPAKQAIEKEAFNRSVEAERYMQWQQQMDELAQIKQRNAQAMEAYQQELATAQAKLATGQAGATEAYHNALLNYRNAQKQLSSIETSAAERARLLRPKMSPDEAYAEYNSARVNPETLPSIELKNTTETVSRLGGSLAKATEDLPKAAGPSGVVEKLVVGLDEAVQGQRDSKQAIPTVKARDLPSMWRDAPASVRARINEQYMKELGITGDDVAMVASGKLRLDQADRILQLVGPNAGNSGLASRLYWSIMEDLRGSTDPMVQGLLRAKSVQRQDIAAGDISTMLRPVPDRFGRETISSASLSKLTSMFRNFERDPKLLKWDERLLVESIPASQRQPLLDLLGSIFKAREDVALAKGAVQAAEPGKVKANLPKPPKLEKEVFSRLPEAQQLREVPMAYTSPGVMGGHVEQLNYALARAAGWNIPGAILASRGFNIVSRLIFRAGMTPEGRAFVKNLYRDTSPNLGDTSRLMALANFIRTMNQAEQEKEMLQ